MDSRLKKDDAAESRGSRAQADRERTGDGLASREERRSAFRSEWIQEVLPAAPKLPGWHTCWLSSTNTYDPIHRRKRVGYELVTPEEVDPSYNAQAMHSAQFPGAICCNEMILYKIREDTYQDMMIALHHEAPMQEAEKLQANYAAIQQRAQMETGGKAKATLEGEGMNPERTRPAPYFEG